MQTEIKREHSIFNCAARSGGRAFTQLPVLLLLVLTPALLNAQFKSVRVQVIDRGQADGILIRTPNKRWVVIDAGVDKLQAASMDTVWHVDSVALAVVSHLHYDHHGGMDDVLRRFPVGRMVMDMTNCPGRAHDDTIRAIIDRRGIPCQSAGADTIVVDGVSFIILPPDPFRDDCPARENDNSILVRMEFGEFSMLFAADAETGEREWLMEQHPELLDVDVLKASHHGSINGVDGQVGGRSWMDIVDPRAVIISALRGNTYGLPDPEAIEIYDIAVGGKKIYCTSRQGTIRVYGRRDGGFSVSKQFRHTGSCAHGSE